MTSDEGALDKLRVENEQLGSRIRRLSVILIGLLAIVTVTITNALEKVDVRDLHRELEKVSESANSAWDDYGHSPLLDMKDQPQANQEDNLKEHERLRNIWQEADQKRRETQKKYDRLLKDSFSITPSLLGSSLSLDLRVWIYTMPFILVFAALYISILRKKQRILLVLAAARVHDNRQRSVLNQLTFSGNGERQTAYARTPSDLEQITYIVVTIFLLTQIISSIADAEVVNLGLGSIETVQYTSMFLTAAFYAFGYYQFTSDLMDRQIRLITKKAAKQSIAIRAWRKIGTAASWLLPHLKPKISLTTGSLLVLASLFLSTAASCGGSERFARKAGYTLFKSPGGTIAELDWRLDQLERVVKNPDAEVENPTWSDPGGGWWISTILQPKVFGLYWKNAIHNLGRYSYFIGTIVALMSLIFVLSSFVKAFQGLLRKPEIVLLVLSTTSSLIMVVDFSFNTYWFKDELFLISNLFWIVPAGFLVSIVLLQRRRARKRLRPFRTILLILLTPLALSATLYVTYVTAKGFLGILAYFIGINLLSITYLNIRFGDPARRKSRVLKDHAQPATST
jgi:hypothetical protein